MNKPDPDSFILIIIIRAKEGLIEKSFERVGNIDSFGVDTNGKYFCVLRYDGVEDSNSLKVDKKTLVLLMKTFGIEADLIRDKSELYEHVIFS